MRRARALFLAVAAASLLAAGCNVCFKSGGRGLWFVTEKQNGKTFEVRPGDHFSVQLPGDPSTGYIWDILAVDEKVLEQLGEAAVVVEGDGTGPAGSSAPGTVSLTFLAARRGTTELRLGYRRPAEKLVLPRKSFAVTVVVR